MTFGSAPRAGPDSGLRILVSWILVLDSRGPLRRYSNDRYSKAVTLARRHPYGMGSGLWILISWILDSGFWLFPLLAKRTFHFRKLGGRSRTNDGGGPASPLTHTESLTARRSRQHGTHEADCAQGLRRPGATHVDPAKEEDEAGDVDRDR